MNRLLASIILVLTAVSASAQAPAGPQPAANVERVASIPKTDLLTPFTAIEIDGPLNVNMKHVDDESEVKIVYDTKGSMTSKFRATVNKDGVLRVEERFDRVHMSVDSVNLLTDGGIPEDCSLLILNAPTDGYELVSTEEGYAYAYKLSVYGTLEMNGSMSVYLSDLIAEPASMVAAVATILAMILAYLRGQMKS